MKQSIVTLDMEGVLTPEIWIAVSEKTGIKELRLTTRDVPDYDVLMKGRLKILSEHNLKLPDIQAVIATLRPLEGALEFLRELRSLIQVIILSDTFEEFAQPLLRQLEWPALCHKLEVVDGRIINYRLRISDQKQKAVAAFKSMNYRVIAAGDSFNDTAMLLEAHVGFLFPRSGRHSKAIPAISGRRNVSGFIEPDQRISLALRLRIAAGQIPQGLNHILALVKHRMDLSDDRRGHAQRLREPVGRTRGGQALRDSDGAG